ncbi:hypothetical protein [Cellulosilyticum ruminicola]|uniref:hypothetical protein n=1 Tax=Cellulosilyticum ruminicola TaxID=425254 RepID=UPI0006CF85B4|nr:hypothetical protein [Cellulosilyticum ruminicola]
MNLTKKKLTLGLITIAILSLLTVLFLMNFHRLNALYPSVTSNYYKLNEPIEFEDLTATITDFELISTKDLCQRLDLTDDEINQFGLKTNTQDMKILVAMDISHSTHKSFIKLCESLTIQSGIYSNGYNLPLAKKSIQRLILMPLISNIFFQWLLQIL